MFVLIWRHPPTGLKFAECPECGAQMQFRYCSPFQCLNCQTTLANFIDLMESQAERAIYHFRGKEALLDSIEE
jgi:hypothetical protein